MQTVFRMLLWSLAVFTILLMSTYLYLRNADLSRYEKQIEGAISSALGHKVDVDGLFELHFGSLTDVTAEDIVITNADWPTDPELLRIGHLSFSVDIWSLISTPVIVEHLELHNAHIVLERNVAGIANWDSGEVREDPAEPRELHLNRVVVKEVRLQNVQYVLDTPNRVRPLDANIEYLAVSRDAADVLDLEMRGRINEYPLSAGGKFGAWQNLIDGRNIAADFDLELNQVRFGLRGSIVDLSALEGVKLSLELQGPAIETVSNVFGLPPFASGPFHINGEIHQIGDGNQVRASGNLGEIELVADGNVDKFLDVTAANLDFSVSGPDMLHVAEVFGIEGAPKVPFQFSGDLELDEWRFQFSRTRAELGDNQLDLDGWLDFGNPIPDVDVTISASGPDFSVIGPFTRLEGIPREAYRASGRIRKTGNDLHFDEVEATVGLNRIAANGSLGPAGGDDTNIFLSVSGPDISVIGSLIGMPDVLPRSFSASANLRPDAAGISLHETSLRVGDNQLEIEGTVSTDNGISGTKLRIHGFGQDLQSISRLTSIPYLPHGAYDYTTSARVSGETLSIEKLDLTVVGATASVDGSVNIGSNAGDFDLQLAAHSNDVGQLELFDSLQQLSGESLRVNGQVRHRNGIFDLTAVTAGVGSLDIAVNGRIDAAGSEIGLTVSANAPDAGILVQFFGDREFPPGPLSVSSQIERTSDTIEFAHTLLRLGEFSAAVDGTLDNSPLSNSSDLRFNVSGPDLQQVGEAFGVAVLSPKTFDISGEVNGTPTGYAIENIDATIGDNAVSGRITADLRGKPSVAGTISATYLDLGSRYTKNGENSDTANSSPFLISDKPLRLGWLDSFDADIELQAGNLIFTSVDMHDFHMALKISDGKLSADPISFSDLGGSVSGHFNITPVDGQFEFDTAIKVENIHFGMSASADTERSTLPLLNGNIELHGSGSSPHQFLSGANGVVSLTQGAGRSFNLAVSRLFGDLITEILHTLNPQREKGSYTPLECAFYDVRIVDGLADIDRFVMQTERVTMAATGNVRLADERLKLSVGAKPRKGIGISVAGFANSFLDVRGTLRHPRLQVNAAATGAAVATAGLTVVAKGLWDRVSGEKNICKELEKN